MNGAVVVIGVFDGVHRGHRALIDRARAAHAGAHVIAVTFDPHPARVLAPERAPAQLLTLAERCAELQHAGVSRTVVVPFTPEFSQWPAERFVDDVLVPLQPQHVCVGKNFRFGHGAHGDVSTLSQLGGERGFTVDAVDLVGDEAAWSSTRIRELIVRGDVAGAAVILGRPHRVRGPVVHGDARGRELGYPTANIDVDTTACVPADGVYAGRLTWLATGAQFDAAVSIGTNPQFGGTQRRIEAYALDATASLDLYGQEVQLEFIDRIRGQQVYPDVPTLMAAIADDVATVRSVCAAQR